MALMNGSHTFRKDHIFFGNLCDVFPANNKLLVKLQKLRLSWPNCGEDIYVSLMPGFSKESYQVLLP